MGYRNYIASIPRKEYNQIKDFSKEELYKFKGETGEHAYVSVYDVAYNEIYGLGKYVDIFPKRLFKSVFTNKELQTDLSEEHDFYLVGKKFLEAVINNYSDKIKANYAKMLAPFFNEKGREPSEFLNTIKTDYGYPEENRTFDFSKITQAEQNQLSHMIEHVKSMGQEWGVCSYGDLMPYNLDKGVKITDSWKYEYAQFELVRIYKTFDWKNNVMIYYGY